MKYLLMLASLPLLCSDPKPTPITYINEVRLVVPHGEGPIPLTLILETKTFPTDNLVDVRLKIFHKKKLVTQRHLEIFW